MNPGIVGGVVGAVGGFLGGVIGTYFSIKNTNSPREKSFMIRCAIVVWIAVIVFLGLLFVIPKPYNYLLWIPYGILLPIGIRYGNRMQTKIREEDKKAAK